jgi:hypothetical protein
MNPRDWHRSRKEHLVAYKGGKCVDCNNIFPACCYDFDHRNPFEKSFSISEASSRGRISIQELEKEADKCDLVCANCHRIRTQGSAQIAEKMSLGLRGRAPWNKGLEQPYSEETLAKMSNSQKQRFEEHPKVGWSWSEEQKARMSKSHKAKGIRPSLEACRSGAQANKR